MSSYPCAWLKGSSSPSPTRFPDVVTFGEVCRRLVFGLSPRGGLQRGFSRARAALRSGLGSSRGARCGHGVWILEGLARLRGGWRQGWAQGRFIRAAQTRGLRVLQVPAVSGCQCPLCPQPLGSIGSEEQWAGLFSPGRKTCSGVLSHACCCEGWELV